MASWMMHFRVADAILQTDMMRGAPQEVAEAFILGNVAPDSGTPLPDGRGYLPDKATSHFMRRFTGTPAGQNPERCDPSLLIEAWLEPALAAGDRIAAAFYLGYLCHLVTDNAWVRDFIYPAKERFSHLRLTDGVETPEGVARFYAFLKKDWYDMDFLYIRHHPELPAYRLFLAVEKPENRYLPFFSADAFAVKRREIEDFYRNGVQQVAEREVYIRDEEAERFIHTVKNEIFQEFSELFSRMDAEAAPCSQGSCACAI